MEVIQNGNYWVIKNTRGPVPKVLDGDWVSKGKAEQAMKLFQQQVQSRAINVSQRNRERKERAVTSSKNNS
jgi:hypothetical protein